MSYLTLSHTNYKKLFIIGFLIAGLFLVSAFFNVIKADSHVSQEQIESALKDLSSAADQKIDSQEKAHDFCNQEGNFEVCAGIGKKHNLYKPEEVAQVDQLISEFKGKVLEDIKNCNTEECLLDVASNLSKRIASKNPNLASRVELTSVKVEEKKSIIQAAKETGVNLKDCREMDPDTAAIDLLRACAKLAKDSRVKAYIPESARDYTDRIDETVKLKDSLASGKYTCGDGTLEGCGNFCLNPGGQARGQGTSAIPLVCRQIAQEVFGPQGIKQLEAAYTQVGKVKDFYATKLILTTPDGKEVTGKNEIRSTCDRAFNNRDLPLAKACGNFAVKNGFVSQEEMEKGFKLMESFVQKGGNVDFNDCVKNPQLCKDFVSEEYRQEVEFGAQIEDIMKTEIGFDPFQCSRGEFDESIGVRCYEGSKRALPKLESLAAKYPQARFIVEDIKSHVSRGDELTKRKDQFTQVFEQQGGPGNCKSEQECRAYCSDANHGPECIAFGARFQLFKGEEAAQRFQQYNQNIQTIQVQTGQPGFPGGFPGQGPYPGFQPPAGQYVPPGQIPGFTQPGPSPECFSAIQRGDFIRAKEVCNVPRIETPIGIYPTPIGPPITIPVCPLGQYWNGQSCVIPATDPETICRQGGGIFENGICRRPTTYSPYPTATYPGGTYSPPPPSGQCPFSFAHDMGGYCMLNSDTSRCASYANAGSEANYNPASCQVYPTYSPQPTYSPGPGGSSCSQSLIGLLGSGCHQMYTDSSGRVIYCDGPMTKSAKEGDTVSTSGCAGTGGPTYSPPPGGFQCSDGKDNDNDGKIDYPADSSCYGPDDNDEYYPPPGVTPGPSGNCPSAFAHDMSGYCMLNSDTSRCASYANAGSEANYNPASCQVYPTYSPQPTYSPYPTSSPTSSGSCPSGSHIMYVNNAGGYCMSDADTTKCGPLNSSSVSGFGSCSAYQTTYPTYSPYYSPYPGGTYSPAPGTTYTPYPSCPSGQWWDSATNSCKSSSSAAYCGNYVCDSGETATSCPTDCGGGGTTYTPYPTYSPVYTYSPPPYSPPPSETYTPPPYSPPPTVSPSPTESPPPSSYIHHQLAVANTIMDCADSGGNWQDGRCVTYQAKASVFKKAGAFIGNAFKKLFR